MLAGIGKGMRWFSTSPKKEMVTIIENCFKNRMERFYVFAVLESINGIEVLFLSLYN